MSLWLEYLDRHFPLEAGEEPVMDVLSAEDCAKIAYEYLGTMQQVIELIGNPHEPAFSWRRVREIDDALKLVVEEGTLDPLGRLSLDGVFELRDRLEWCVAALTLEQAAGSGWSQPVPDQAAEDTRTIAVLLALLDGPGREYPRRPSA